MDQLLFHFPPPPIYVGDRNVPYSIKSITAKRIFVNHSKVGWIWGGPRGDPEGKGAFLNSGPSPHTEWTLRLRAGTGHV